MYDLTEPVAFTELLNNVFPCKHAAVSAVVCNTKQM